MHLCRTDETTKRQQLTLYRTGKQLLSIAMRVVFCVRIAYCWELSRLDLICIRLRGASVFCQLPRVCTRERIMKMVCGTTMQRDRKWNKHVYVCMKMQIGIQLNLKKISFSCIEKLFCTIQFVSLILEKYEGEVFYIKIGKSCRKRVPGSNFWYTKGFNNFTGLENAKENWETKEYVF